MNAQELPRLIRHNVGALLVLTRSDGKRVPEDWTLSQFETIECNDPNCVYCTSDSGNPSDPTKELRFPWSQAKSIDIAIDGPCILVVHASIHQQLDLDAIEARANSAMAGPWKAEEYRGFNRKDAEWVVWMNDAKTEDNTILEQPDAEFIAHAREDVPALVAEVRRTRKENDRLRRVAQDKSEQARKAKGG